MKVKASITRFFTKARRFEKKFTKKVIQDGANVIKKNMKQSMKDKPRGIASPPGTPPFAHRKKRGARKSSKRLKDTITAPVRDGIATIGPSYSSAKKLGKLHNEGGMRFVTEPDPNQQNGTKKKRQERGYDPRSVPKNKPSARKQRAGMRAMSEKEIEAIRKHYRKKQKNAPPKKRVSKRYPKRPFAVKALKQSLSTIQRTITACKL